MSFEAAFRHHSAIAPLRSFIAGDRRATRRSDLKVGIAELMSRNVTCFEGGGAHRSPTPYPPRAYI